MSGTIASRRCRGGYRLHEDSLPVKLDLYVLGWVEEEECLICRSFHHLSDDGPKGAR
jgi:hypothetical protein